jgi:hypothetical protein
VDRSSYNADIAWVVNDMAAALGERGASVDPSGGGGRTITDNWPMIERLHAAIPDVRTARRLRAIWDRLTPRHQNVLSAYYTARQVVVTRGATAAFGQHARVAMMLAEVAGTKGRLILALSDQNNARHVPVVTEARSAAEVAVEAAHEAWQEARKKRADDCAEGAP